MYRQMRSCVLCGPPTQAAPSARRSLGQQRPGRPPDFGVGGFVCKLCPMEAARPLGGGGGFCGATPHGAGAGLFRRFGGDTACWFRRAVAIAGSPCSSKHKRTPGLFNGWLPVGGGGGVCVCVCGGGGRGGRRGEGGGGSLNWLGGWRLAPLQEVPESFVSVIFGLAPASVAPASSTTDWYC